MTQRVTLLNVRAGEPLPAADAYVVADVIRASTTVVTAAASGRDCYPVRSVDEAFLLGAALQAPLLAGELHGEIPAGFDLQNSPSAMQGRNDHERALVLLSTSGAPTMLRASELAPTWVVSLRNIDATAAVLRDVGDVVVLMASNDGLRVEDAICGARLVSALANGAEMDPETARLRDWCAGLPLDIIRDGPSAAYLRRSGQEDDLEFVLGHVGDVTAAYAVRDGRVRAPVPEPVS
jgi:2-phosphosulfolactate phosphatase